MAMLARGGRRNLGGRIGSTNLGLCGLVILFCGGASLACSPLRQNGTSDSATQRRPSKDTVPIVYQSERFTPLRLNPQQIDEFLSTATKAMPTGPSVWFILVRSNSKHDGELSYNVIVYFRPDETTARFRKGRYLHLDNWWNSLGITINTALNNHQIDWTNRLKSYFQVSQADRPFDKKLGVPNGSMLPFDAPEGFKADEIIDIVDFVRSNPTHTPPAPKAHPNSFSSPTQLDGSASIVAIEKEDDTIEIRTGTVEGLLSGIGQLLRIVRDGGDFKILSIGVWVY